MQRSSDLLGSTSPQNTGQNLQASGVPRQWGHIADGYSHDDIRTCVAVAYPMPDYDADEQRVIPPCGTCRELLADYNESMRVIVPVDGDYRVARAIDLLPARTW